MKNNIYNKLVLLSSIFIIFGLNACNSSNFKKGERVNRPNILVVIADQWRADAFGYRGNPDVKTPNIDKLASEGIVFVNAVSGLPVCTPARASILTGQRPLTNGVFMNDVQLDTNAVSLAKVMNKDGYQTAYIGKWHLDGHGRKSFIPQGNRRQGFNYWKVLECTHNYNHSIYYAGSPDTLLWNGYDAFAHTEDACKYIQDHANDKNPFLLVLSWGPPHEPYHTAPEKYQEMYSPENIVLKPNVPKDHHEKAKKDLSGYYAHCTALDDMIEKLRKKIHDSGIEQNTIILFLSDHGDLLGSHGYYKKWQPYDESIRIPMIFYVPKELNGKASTKEAMINLEDVMPTLLGFSSIEVPQKVEGIDYSRYILGDRNPGDTTTLITCIQPFGIWSKKQGGREYRGLRSTRYTYAKDLNGPWLFFDNQTDPYQMNNLVNNEKYGELIKSFDNLLTKKLDETDDQFLSGLEYVKKYNYPKLNDNETVPY